MTRTVESLVEEARNEAALATKGQPIEALWNELADALEQLARERDALMRELNQIRGENKG